MGSSDLALASRSDRQVTHSMLYRGVATDRADYASQHGATCDADEDGEWNAEPAVPSILIKVARATSSADREARNATDDAADEDADRGAR